MLNRHQSRELTLQSLFNVDFLDNHKVDTNSVYQNILHLFYSEKYKSDEVKQDEYSFSLFNNILKKKQELDDIIKKYLNDWSLEKTAIIDRNILRIGLYEMLFQEDVPNKVAINESIELSKSFGHKNSYKFISGVLGKIFDDLLKNKV